MARSPVQTSRPFAGGWRGGTARWPARRGIAAGVVLLAVTTALGGCVTLGDPLSHPGNRFAVLATSHGNITVELFATRAPVTVGNFLNHTASGFYDGLLFHRVLQGFVIQGGGVWPNGTEKPTPFPPIPLEIDPALTHRDGCLAMAREEDPDSATSQFYICDGPQHRLDDAQRQREQGTRGYAVFGRVLQGLPVVRNIASQATDSDDRPVRNVLLQRVTEIAPT